ncbi:hypothetical protein NXS19_001514 [Fusarium pseudograminearum]|nr:hypothetical protein NXS19_001514 [Fusarium pseudograminearum]
MALWRSGRDLGSTGMPVSSAKLSQEFKTVHRHYHAATIAWLIFQLCRQDVKVGLYASADPTPISVRHYISYQDSWPVGNAPKGTKVD